MSFPKKLFIKSVFVLAIIIVVLFIISFVSAYFALRDPSKYWVLTLILIGFFFYPLNEKVVNWLDKKTGPTIEKTKKDAHNGRLGFKGEDEVKQWLDNILDPKQFIILRNVSLPNRIADIDLVVVGPKGVIAIEVKNYSSPRAFEPGAYYEIVDGNDVYLSPDKDPRYRSKDNKVLLERFFNEQGWIDIPVHSILAFAGEVTWRESPDIYIARDEASLRKYMDRLMNSIVCTPETCKHIQDLLVRSK